jgi:hypothetical protein
LCASVANIIALSNISVFIFFFSGIIPLLLLTPLILHIYYIVGLKSIYGLISKTGLPSIISTPRNSNVEFSALIIFTMDIPMPLGLCGDLVE